MKKTLSIIISTILVCGFAYSMDADSIIETNSTKSQTLVEYKETPNGNNVFIDYTLDVRSDNGLTSPCLTNFTEEKRDIKLELDSIDLNMSEVTTKDIKAKIKEVYESSEELKTGISILKTIPYYYEDFYCEPIYKDEIDTSGYSDEQVNYIDSIAGAEYQANRGGKFILSQQVDLVTEIQKHKLDLTLKQKELEDIYKSLVEAYSLDVCPLLSDNCTCRPLEKAIDGVCVAIVEETTEVVETTSNTLSESEEVVLQALVSQINSIIENMSKEKQAGARTQVLTVFQQLPAISKRTDVDMGLWSDYLVSIW